eukprot:363610-Chlamydomonas_euryale.AAC.10
MQKAIQRPSLQLCAAVRRSKEGKKGGKLASCNPIRRRASKGSGQRQGHTEGGATAPLQLCASAKKGARMRERVFMAEVRKRSQGTRVVVMLGERQQSWESVVTADIMQHSWKTT